jgi:hypothetical protein
MAPRMRGMKPEEIMELEEKTVESELAAQLSEDCCSICLEHF